MYGTGVPVAAAETAGPAGKNDNERARTREVKLGCVFTQSQCDEHGRLRRDEASTTYTGARAFRGGNCLCSRPQGCTMTEPKSKSEIPVAFSNDM